MADEPFRLLGLDLAVLHLHLYGFIAIEAHRIDLYRLTGKEPADRQRFESSLAEPLLLPVDGQAVLGREVVERGKGNDGVALRKEPTGETANRE